MLKLKAFLLIPLIALLLIFSAGVKSLNEQDYVALLEMHKQADIVEATIDCGSELVEYQLFVYSDRFSDYRLMKVFLPKEPGEENSQCGYLVRSEFGITPIKVGPDQEIVIQSSRQGCFRTPAVKLAFQTDHSGLVFTGHEQLDQLTGSFSLTPL